MAQIGPNVSLETISIFIFTLSNIVGDKQLSLIKFP